MRPLYVVDLESVADAEAGRLVVERVHAGVAPDRELVVVGPDARDFDDAAGIVVTGSQAMLEDVDWALGPDGLAAALVAAAERGVPVLGVCFAHQMLAAHLGGTVGSFPAVRKGLPDITFQEAGPFRAQTVALLHTHRDHVAVAPPETDAVATGGLGGVPALAHRRLPLWTMQGHPEWDHAVCRHDDAYWARFKDAALDTPEAKGILARFGSVIAGRGKA